MTTHAPIPTVRRAAGALLAAVLLAGLATGAIAGDGENVQFYLHPVDSTVVAGHQVCFYVETECSVTSSEYQWYRNDVAIPGATSQFYRFTAQSADHGARYHVVVQGLLFDKYYTGAPRQGPTPSNAATLTVLPAGSTLTPTITMPDVAAFGTSYDTAGKGLPQYAEFRATGNDLEWTWRYDTEEGDVWHVLPTPMQGAQAVRFNYHPPVSGPSALTVRVTDDAGVAATRTWQLAFGAPAPLSPYYYDVSFTAGPVDSTAVAGRQATFYVYTSLDPVGPPPPSYQWYRNGVAIPGATTNPYSLIAQAGDDGAVYHVVASGVYTSTTVFGPTASPPATLTVLPAGTNLPPALIYPEAEALYNIPDGDRYWQGFRAIGNGLQWSYRYNNDPPDTWRALAPETTGSQYVRFQIGKGNGTPRTSITLRILDDLGVAATRTWAFMSNRAPNISAVTVVGSNPVPWPGPVTLTVSASDPDGDPLTYAWYVDYATSVEGGDAVFTPSGNTCTATFTKFGYYYITAVALDGKGGVSTLTAEKIVVEPTFDVRADLNHDGVVNALDLGIVVDNFGQVIP